jgi:hypothetical protein
VPREPEERPFADESQWRLPMPSPPEPHADFLCEHAQLNDGPFRLGNSSNNIGCIFRVAAGST